MKSRLVTVAFLASLALPHGPVTSQESAPRPALAIDLIERFGDTTQTLEDGVAYYSATGVLLVVRNEELTKGRWSARDDGTLCWELDGSEPDCTRFVMVGDIVHHGEGGLPVGQPDLVSGNLLAEAASAMAYANSAELFTPEETRAFLSGKTALRSAHGRLYYAPDQVLHTVWHGVRKQGTWSIDEHGGVCWHITGWGEQPCEYYFVGHNGTVWSRFRGLDQVAAEHVAGDRTEF
ncbi:MAG: hypothetical protein AAGA28_18920 [Pseudomonadota bacterium]